MRERLHRARKTVAIITPDEAKRRLDAGGVTLIDVDEEWQLRERGTIAGARNMRGELEIKVDTEQQRRDPALQDRARAVILTCGAGGKATLSATTLQEMGFTNVSMFEGGCRGWQKAFGLSLIPPRSAEWPRHARTNRAGSAAPRHARPSASHCPS